MKVLRALGELLRVTCETVAHESLSVAICSTQVELDRVLEGGDAWTMACVDIGKGEGMDQVYMIRRLCQGAGLLLVVDEGVSPLTYIRPGIMPSGLVQRPVAQDVLRFAIDEFVRYLLLDSTEVEDESSFSFEGKDGMVRVPYRSIIGFEARSKRIFVRMRREQYGFYDTLDKLLQRLPEGFIRCHRGYIINVGRVRRLDLSTAEVIMDDGTHIPVSRTYRTQVREALS